VRVHAAVALRPQVFRAVAERAALIDLPARVAQVRAALAAAGLDVVDVSGRVKNIYGVWRKLQAGGLGVDRIDEVYDVAALRVVVPHKHDCYRALREVEGLWAAVPGRFKVRQREGWGPRGVGGARAGWLATHRLATHPGDVWLGAGQSGGWTAGLEQRRGSHLSAPHLTCLQVSGCCTD
jgi:hypothetical protein